MNTPKEALDSLLAYRHGDTKHLTPEHARILYETLASLGGDAVERVARIVEPDGFCSEPNPDDSELVRAARRHSAREKARAILATGLVPDEAAIRAAAFEEAAKIAEAECYATTGRQIAAAIRSNRREA